MKKKQLLMPAKNKLAIVALAYTGRHAPFDDPTFDIWTLNGGCRLYEDKRIDRLFDLHDWVRADYEPDYFKWLIDKKELEYPIVKSRPDERIQHHRIVLFPQREIVDIFSSHIDNSIPAMIAHAYLEGYRKIYLFGMNALEFMRQPVMGFSLYHTIGICRGRGMQIFFITDFYMDFMEMYGYDKLLWKYADTFGDSEGYEIKESR